MISQIPGLESPRSEGRAGTRLPGTAHTTACGSLAWTRIRLSAGQVLYHEGATTERLFSLHSGLVKEITHLPNGRIRTVGLHGPGALLGLEVPLDGAVTHGHTAAAVTPVVAACAPTVQLRRLQLAGSEQYLELIERHCETLDRARSWLTEFVGDTASCRIARAIRHLAELQRLGPGLIELLTCQDMGEIVGVSTESASRVLARFKRMGALEPQGRQPGSRFYRFDPAAISRLAER